MSTFGAEVERSFFLGGGGGGNFSVLKLFGVMTTEVLHVFYPYL